MVPERNPRTVGACHSVCPTPLMCPCSGQIWGSELSAVLRHDCFILQFIESVDVDSLGREN